MVGLFIIIPDRVTGCEKDGFNYIADKYLITK